MGKRAGGVLVASIAALTGCSGSNSNTAPSGTTSRTAATTEAAPTTLRRRPTTTTTTTVPEFSFDNSVPPPKLVNTGTNYVSILKSLLKYADWLSAHHPSSALAPNVVASGTRLLTLFSRDLVRLRANRRREVEVLRSPSQYTIVSATADAFSVSVLEDALADRVVMEGGRVTSEIRYDTPATYLNLAVLVNGHWVLAAIDEKQSAHVHL